MLAGLSALSPLSAGRAGAGGGMQRQPDGADRRRAERSAALGRRGPRLQLQPERTLRGRRGGRLPARTRGQRHLRLHPAGPGGRHLVPPAHRAARRRRGSQHLPADRYGRGRCAARDAGLFLSLPLLRPAPGGGGERCIYSYCKRTVLPCA